MWTTKRSGTLDHSFVLSERSKIVCLWRERSQTISQSGPGVTRDVGMKLRADKCAVFHLRRGRSPEFSENVQLADGSIFRHLDAEETYKYLGIERAHDAPSLFAASIDTCFGRFGLPNSRNKTRCQPSICLPFQSCSTPLE